MEYVDFQDIDEHREFRFRLRGLDGSSEVRIPIRLAAFSGRVRLQDGPDVCYQKLLRTADTETVSPEAITIDEADLASYADAHTKAPKHKSWSSSSPTTDMAAPARPHRPAPVSTNDAAPALQGGQRVSHAVFGLGVMSPPSGDHTVVQFDQDGPRRFVTAMLEVHVLSAPRTWETSPRGKNKPCS